jgi:hypothetical protein
MGCGNFVTTFLSTIYIEGLTSESANVDYCRFVCIFVFKPDSPLFCIVLTHHFVGIL